MAQRLAAVRQTVLDRTEHEGERRPELVADVAEEGGLGGVELAQPGVGLAELAVGRRQLAAALQDLALHRARLIAQTVAELAGLYQLGHILDPVEDVGDLAA